MIAENNEYMKESSKTIFQLSTDKLVHIRCRDRKEYYDDICSYQHAIEKHDTTINEQSNTIAKKEAENARLRQKPVEADIDPDSK